MPYPNHPPLAAARRRRAFARPPGNALLCVAIALLANSCGEKPNGGAAQPQQQAEPPEPQTQGSGVRFVERAAELGIEHVHTDGSSGDYFIVETLASGVATFDYDDDGLLDLYFPNGRPLTRGGVQGEGASHALYRQSAAGEFVDVTEDAAAGGTGYGIGSCVGDFDGDSDLDLYVTQFGANVLYRNNGDGTFTDVTTEAGVGDPGLSAGACFFDFDADGDLDLYVANYCEVDLANDQKCLHNNVPGYCAPEMFTPVHDTLYRNEGGGRFTDVSVESGIRSPKPGRGCGLMESW